MDVDTISTVRKEVKKEVRTSTLLILSHIDLLGGILILLKAFSLWFLREFHLSLSYLLIGGLIGIYGIWLGEKVKERIKGEKNA